MTTGAEQPTLRVAELVAALSLATDLGMGQPLEHGLQSCVLAVRLAQWAGASDEQVAECYYQALLRFIGCTAETHVLSALFGDELAMRADYASVDPANLPELLRFLYAAFRRGQGQGSALAAAATLGLHFPTLPAFFRREFAGHCEVAERLAARLGFPAPIVAALGQLYERWDGRGMPHGLRGEAIAFSVRTVTLAQDALVFHRAGGVEGAVTMVQQRRGTAHDPALADPFILHAGTLLAGLDDTPWEHVLALEPKPQRTFTVGEMEGVLRAVADFADLKSPYLLGHSSGVAELAARAAAGLGWDQARQRTTLWAGLVHDVGRVGIPTGIWDKPGPLTAAEWERVRLHSYYTERVLSQSPLLATLKGLAGGHHERLDGSGYHRGTRGQQLSAEAQVLAAADAYHAMTEPRPHRAALTQEAAAAGLRREADAGRLARNVVEVVLEAAGHAPARQPANPGALTDREQQVLRTMARGGSMREVAAALGIAPKTVDNHIQHIYDKIGVRSRAAATLYALEHGLFGPPAEK